MTRFALVNDLGREPLLLAHFSTDKSHVAILTGVGGLVLGSFFGPLGLVLAAWAAYNDIKYAEAVESGLLSGKSNPLLGPTEDFDELAMLPPPMVKIPAMPSTDAVVKASVSADRHRQIADFDLFPTLPDVPLIERRAVAVDRAVAVERRTDLVSRIEVKPTTSTVEDQLWGICDRDNNFYIVGRPGSGKGMFAANLIRRKLKSNPRSIVLALDPKGDKKEDGYWDHPQIHRYQFRGMVSTKAEWDAEVIAFLEVSQAHIKRVLDHNANCPDDFCELWIMFDEMMALKRNASQPVFEMVKTALSNAVCMGDSTGIHGICVTQSFNAGDSVDSEEVLKNLCLIGTFSQDDYSRVAKIVRLGKTNVSSMSEGEFSSIAAKSPRGRVMCVGGQFVPAPELHNYSAWDRDSSTVIAPSGEPAIESLNVDPWDGTAIATPQRTAYQAVIEPVAGEVI